MGIFLSKLRYTKSLVSNSNTAAAVTIDLPVDVLTCVLEFLLDGAANDDEHTDANSIVAFRLVSKSTKLAFEKIHGWNLLYKMYQRRLDILSQKIQILSATIADPPSLTCILKFDAYLTQCWTLKNELSLERNVLQEEVLGNIAKQVKGVNVIHTRAKNNNDKKKNSLVLISEWEGDECVLKFEDIGDDSLHGFSLPAIDSSELPFFLA